MTHSIIITEHSTGLRKRVSVGDRVLVRGDPTTVTRIDHSPLAPFPIRVREGRWPLIKDCTFPDSPVVESPLAAKVAQLERELADTKAKLAEATKLEPRREDYGPGLYRFREEAPRLYVGGTMYSVTGRIHNTDPRRCFADGDYEFIAPLSKVIDVFMQAEGAE